MEPEDYHSPPVALAEPDFWRSVGRDSWRRLHGDLSAVGYSVEAHRFRVPREIDWAGSFQPGTVEVCLNLSGDAELVRDGCRMRFGRGTMGYFRVGEKDFSAGSAGCSAVRASRQDHDFTTLTFSVPYLRRALAVHEKLLTPLARATVFGDGKPAPRGEIEARPMRQAERDLCLSLNAPPVSAPASGLYYQAKVMEVFSILFLGTTVESEDFFCVRQRKIATGRVAQVHRLLSAALDAPPTLKALGKSVGCSPFYLSRVFSETTGMTISQYLKRLRVERAADLLASGRFNVGEAAVEVGYQSLSHFSKAFRDVKGCTHSDYNG